MNKEKDLDKRILNSKEEPNNVMMKLKLMLTEDLIDKNL